MTNETQTIDHHFDWINYHVGMVRYYTPTLCSAALQQLEGITEEVKILQTEFNKEFDKLSGRNDELQTQLNNTALTLKTAQAENLRLETALQNLYDAVRPYVGDRLPVKVAHIPMSKARVLLAKYEEARKC